MRKKPALLIIVISFVLFAGIIAFTQVVDSENETIEYSFDIISDPRWFKSNAGGMVLEEVQSQFIALRSEYALVIDNVHFIEMPEYLTSYYTEDFLIEKRTLFKNAKEIRVQWIFREKNGNTRVNAVFFENDIKGFIEVFDQDYFLIYEYRFLDDGGINKIEYEFNNNLLISAVFSEWEDGDNYIKKYADYFRYNRTLSLRSAERIFYSDVQIQTDKENEIARITFPRNIEAAKENLFISERVNLYPEFFGIIFIESDSRMVFETDDRGRILRQILYNNEDKIIWTINNTWENNRIISTVKTEGDIVLSAEYKYNNAGEVISEANYKNGALERIIRIEGNYSIEELYMNNTAVMRAVWEDGRKISETRIRN
ncbi:MAG: hypothetical protein FWD28_04075 [Treponema sp.]|nr:hypothetical protein [Treponema sp.]